MVKRDLLILNCKYDDPTSEIGHISFTIVSFNEEVILGKLESIKSEYYGVEWNIEAIDSVYLEDDFIEVHRMNVV
ncbi:MAG: hypothetical protein ACRCZ1_00770 [Cetobacterium sp.]